MDFRAIQTSFGIFDSGDLKSKISAVRPTRFEIFDSDDSKFKISAVRPSASVQCLRGEGRVIRLSDTQRSPLVCVDLNARQDWYEASKNQDNRIAVIGRLDVGLL